MKPPFVLLQYVTPQHLLSRLVGFMMNVKIKWLKNAIIKWFVWKYQVDMKEAQDESPSAYENFNHFFTRHLKPGARKIILDDKKIISPADGAISQMDKINDNQLIQAKGINYSLEVLLANQSHLVREFRSGQFACIYLSPKDYHRVHMPVKGKLKEVYYIPGNLFSVNDVTAQHVPNLFARNERMLAIFDTDLGSMAVLMVGAMLVASIHTAWQGQITPSGQRGIQHWQYEDKNISLNQGDELGYFCLGSTVILLFAENSAQWQNGFSTGSDVRLGDILGGTVSS